MPDVFHLPRSPQYAPRLSCWLVLLMSVTTAPAAPQTAAPQQTAAPLQKTAGLRPAVNPSPADEAGVGDSAGIRADDSFDISQLSTKDYSTRQRATMQMWRRREQSRDEVQRAARAADPEVANRARWILRQWRRGFLPDTPPEIQRLLRRTDQASAIEPLLEAGQFRAAVVAVEESAGTIELETMQQRASQALTNRFPVYAQLAMEKRALPELIRLIDLVADSKELAVCRVQLMQRAGLEIPDGRLLPLAAEAWTEQERVQTTVLLLLVLDRLDEAIVQAERARDPELLRVCLMLSGQWQRLASHDVLAARQAEAGSLEFYQLWSDVLVAADRCGDQPRRREAIEHLAAGPADEADEPSEDAGGLGDPDRLSEDDPVQEIRWRTLAIHGEVDRALPLLAVQDSAAAAEVALTASRVEKAFELLGYPLAEQETKLHMWLQEAIEAQLLSERPQLVDEMNRLLELMRVNLRIGRDDLAWQIAHTLAESEVPIGDLHLREFVVVELTSTTRDDWVVTLAVPPGGSSISAVNERCLVRTLPDMDNVTFQVLLRATSNLLQDVPFRRRVHVLCELIRGNVPAELDRSTFGTDLYANLHSPIVQPDRLLQQFARQPRQAPWSVNMAKLFLKHGETRIANEILHQLAQRGEMDAALLLAELALDAGQSEQAERQYLTVWQRLLSADATVVTPGDRRPAAVVDPSLAIKATVGLREIARRRSNRDTADQLQQQIELMLCTPSTELRAEAGAFLIDQGENELATQVFDSLLPMTAFGSREATEFYDIARSYAVFVGDNDPAEAARWFDLAIAGTLETVSFRPSGYVFLPEYVARWSLQHSIAQRDSDAIRHDLDRLEQLDPLDVDVAERLLPLLRQAGMAQLADQMLDRVLDRGISHVETFPFDATTCNNLAWVAAMNDRRLTDALRLAERAVYQEPESAVFRDTLAEILFRLGRTAEALHIERACLIDDPDQWHLHEQVQRFTEAL